MVLLIGVLGAGPGVGIQPKVGAHLGKGVEGQAEFAHEAGKPKGHHPIRRNCSGS